MYYKISHPNSNIKTNDIHIWKIKFISMNQTDLNITSTEIYDEWVVVYVRSISFFPQILDPNLKGGGDLETIIQILSVETEDCTKYATLNKKLVQSPFFFQILKVWKSGDLIWGWYKHECQQFWLPIDLYIGLLNKNPLASTSKSSLSRGGFLFNSKFFRLRRLGGSAPQTPRSPTNEILKYTVMFFYTLPS